VEARARAVQRMIPAELEEKVRALGREMPGTLAVFDADGTLWRDDVGEAFLRHLVKLGWVKLPDGSDPYEVYEHVVDRDRASGYAFAAQLQAGLEVEKVKAEAVSFAGEWVPPRLVTDTQALRALCVSAGLKPFVVSASALPVVQAAAPLAGFRRDLCRGIEVAVLDGRFAVEVKQPITYAEGKVAVAQFAGRIALACGDSLTGDLPLLRVAALPVVVAPAAGSPLSAEANRNGWFVLSQDG
jgi:phosphoserine phosphatase